MQYSSKEVRQLCRENKFKIQHTAGLCPGYVQTNLIVLNKTEALDFLIFCQRNPKSCPVVDISDIGDPEFKLSAPDSDVRTDLPLYNVYRDGKLLQPVQDIQHLWTSDMVAILLGCSFSFEEALIQHGLSIRHLVEGKNVPMYRTNLPCTPSGSFRGNMVVSMRPFTPKDAIRATEITSRFPKVHGSPVHFGNPQEIGIQSLDAPDWGQAVSIKPDEIPVFWACGVTPQAVAIQSKLPLVITHSPGAMFITDLKNASLAS